MRVAQQWILRQGRAVFDDRLLLALEVFQQDGEVERQQRARGLRLSIQPFRLLELTVEVQQSAKVDARFEMIFLQAQRREVGGASGNDVRFLEPVTASIVVVRTRTL